MIQGQINSMIAQIGNMAHVGKTLRNTEKTLSNEKKVKKVETNIESRDELFGIQLDHDIYGAEGQVDPELAKKIIQRTDAYDYKARGFTKNDWDIYKAGLATNLTIEQLANMNELREQMRKPSTVKTPGGKNDGK